MGREDIIPRVNVVDTNLFRHLGSVDQNTSFAIVLRVISSRTTPYGVLYFRFYRIPLPIDEAGKIDLQSCHDVDLLHQQVAVPFSPQTPTIDIGPTIKARVGSERVYINDDPTCPVDMVDIVVADKDMMPHLWSQALVYPKYPGNPESSMSPETLRTPGSSETLNLSFCLDFGFRNQSTQVQSQHGSEVDEHDDAIGPVSTPPEDGRER